MDRCTFPQGRPVSTAANSGDPDQEEAWMDRWMDVIPRDTASIYGNPAITSLVVVREETLY